MSARIVLAIGVALFAAAANAGIVLHMYFSSTNSLEAVPPEYEAGENPAVTAGETVYLWAKVLPSLSFGWNGVSLDFVGPAVTAGEMYNPLYQGYYHRWNPGSDLDPAGDNHVFMVAVIELGLGHPLDENIDGHYRVGELAWDDWGGASELFLGVGPEGIAAWGPPVPQLIYFGFTPDGQPDGPLYGNQFGAMTAFPDVVPEPASALLAGLVALALRRR